MATVSRSDITLEETQDVTYSYSEPGFEVTRQYWTASVDGYASSKERVSMSRIAQHAGEALLILEEALKAEGYEVR